MRRQGIFLFDVSFRVLNVVYAMFVERVPTFVGKWRGYSKIILDVFFRQKSIRENETPFYNDMLQETLLQLLSGLYSAQAKQVLKIAVKSFFGILPVLLAFIGLIGLLLEPFSPETITRY